MAPEGTQSDTSNGPGLAEYASGGPSNSTDPSGLWDTGTKVAYRVENIWQNGQCGAIVRYYQMWGSWYQPEWNAQYNGQCREWQQFEPYAVQPPSTAKHKPPKIGSRDDRYMSGSGAAQAGEFFRTTANRLEGVERTAQGVGEAAVAIYTGGAAGAPLPLGCR